MLGALTFVVFFFLPFSEALPGAASTLWTCLVLAVVVATVFVGQGKRPVYTGVWVSAAFLTFIGIVSSAGASDSIRGHMIIGAQVLLFIAFGPFALRRLASAPTLVRNALAAVLIGQSVSALAALAQASGMTVLGWKTVSGRASGLASHPNIVGVLSSVAIVVFLYLIFKTARKRLPLVVGLAVNVGALLVSGSISALIACFIGVLVFMTAARVSLKVPAIMAVVGGLALWFIGQLSSAGMLRGPAQRIAQVTGQTNDISTLDIRQNTYAFAWDSIQKDPFYGRGLDSSSGATFDHITLTHNILLRAWFQGGLGIGLAFALIVAAIACLVIRAVFFGRDAASAGVLAVIIGFSMTSAALQQGYFWLLIFGAVALIEPKLLVTPTGVTGDSLVDVERRPVAAVVGAGASLAQPPRALKADRG